MVVAIFSKNGPWSVSIVDVTIGFGSSASVQCWEKVSFFFVDILTAVATTVIVTAAVTVLVTTTVTVAVSVTGRDPCSYCCRHSFSASFG